MPPCSGGTPRSPTGTCSCTRCRCSTATAGGCRTRSPAWGSLRWWYARPTGRGSSGASAPTASPCSAAPPPWWGEPEESEGALAGGWFHTGDEGHLEDADYLVISDRKKDVIISGGENVSSVEVEDCLYQHAAVAEAAVIGVPDDRWGETVKALVVLRQGHKAT